MSRKNNGISPESRQEADVETQVYKVTGVDGTSDEPKDESLEPSKSHRKREADAIRELGRELAELGRAERATIPLDDDIVKAIEDLQAIRQHGARKRQLGFLAKRLRRVDIEPIQAALDRLARAARASGERHHRIEAWRDRLLGGTPDESASDALTAFLDAYPAADRQRLRQRQKQALAEREQGRTPTAARELFRQLRETMTAHDEEPSSGTEPDDGGDRTGQ